jgi:hypothetical protein
MAEESGLMFRPPFWVIVSPKVYAARGLPEGAELLTDSLVGQYFALFTEQDYAETAAREAGLDKLGVGAAEVQDWALVRECLTRYEQIGGTHVAVDKWMFRVGDFLARIPN